MKQLRLPREQWPIAIALVVWVVGSVGGMAMLWSYSAGPGMSAQPPARLVDAEKQIAPIPGANNLLLFLHPKCYCSQATVNMTARFLAQAKTKPLLRVFMVLPEGKPESWAKDTLWKSIEALAPTEIRVDVNGKVAEAMGVKTSGQVLLYDAKGELRYAGGLTSGRGHEGCDLGSG